MQPDFSNQFCASEYSAIITIRSNSSRRLVYNGQSIFPATSLPFIMPLSTQIPNYSSFASRVPVESHPIRVSTVYTRRLPRDTRIQESFQLTSGNGHKFQLIPARPLPKYPFDASLAFPFSKLHSYSHLSSRSDPSSSSPSSSSSATSSKLKRKPVAGMHEREKLTPLNSQVMLPSELTAVKFDLVHFITVQSMTAKQVLFNGLLYINPRSSCAPNLKEGEKIVIWGRLASGNSIRLNLCNSLSYATLNQEERQIVNSFLQGERDCKRRKR